MGDRKDRSIARRLSNKSLRIEMKEWTAVALCLFSAAGVYVAVARLGVELTRPLILSFMCWAMIGAWLGNFATLFDAQVFKFCILRRHLIRISPLARSTFRLTGVSLAALAIFKVSGLFL